MSERDHRVPDSNRGLNRRDLIKRGAIVGGVALWAPPVVESLTSRAFAGSAPPCPPGASYGLSGLTIVYLRGGILYWTFVGSGGSACDAGGGSISNDDSFTTSCGANTLTVNTPSKGVTWNGAAPVNDTTCYFVATARGANVTAAGQAAGVQVVAWIGHDGSFQSSPSALGSKKHFEVQCGSAHPTCATF